MYHNIKMIHPNGNLMCFCDLKKANWYNKMGLGIFNIETRELHLLFEPNGEGEPDVELLPKYNVCAISGLSTNLSKHHIVPYCYRRFFPKEYKSKNSLDVVALEREIHSEYEVEADKLKNELESMLSINYKERNIAFIRCRKFLRNIKVNARYIDPKIYIMQQIRYENYIKEYNFTEDELINLKNIEEAKFRDVVTTFGVEELIVIWKLHFVKYGMPKYINENWHPFQIKVTKKQSEITLFKADETFIKLLEKLDLKDIYDIYLQKIEL